MCIKAVSANCSREALGRYGPILLPLASLHQALQEIGKVLHEPVQECRDAASTNGDVQVCRAQDCKNVRVQDAEVQGCRSAGQ